MRDNKIIELTYKGFQRHHACTFPIEPYCLKMFQKRWYILTHSINDDEIRLYAMDRIESASVTDTCFTLPKDFDAKSYFASFFGIVLDKDIKEEKSCYVLTDIINIIFAHFHFTLHNGKYTLLMNMQISNCIFDRHTTSVWSY